MVEGRATRFPRASSRAKHPERVHSKRAEEVGVPLWAVTPTGEEGRLEKAWRDVGEQAIEDFCESYIGPLDGRSSQGNA